MSTSRSSRESLDLPVNTSSNLKAIHDQLGLHQLDQTTSIIYTSLTKSRPRLFDTRGLCAGYPLEPSPDEYFVAHEVSPEKIADLRHALEQGLADTQLKPYTPDQDIRPGHILCKIAAKIQTTAFCIFDLPESQNRNVYLELGIAIGLGRPFILIKSDKSQVPSLVEGLDYFGFSSYAGLRREVGERVQVGQFSAVLPREDVSPTDTYFLADGEFEGEDLREAIRNALQGYALRPVYLAEGQVGPQLALKRLIRDIQAARFGIYRIDEKASANTHLALGIAIGLNKPWLLVAREGAAIPQDVRGLSNFNFRSFTQVERELTERCGEFLERYAGKKHDEQIPPKFPLQPPTLLDFSQATPSSLRRDWEPYGDRDESVDYRLEIDSQLRQVLAKSGRGFHAALRYPPGNLRWPPYRYYEMVIKSSDLDLALHINVAVGDEDRTLFYGPAQRYGPNPEVRRKEFQIPLDERVCDGTWHSVILDLMGDAKEAGWSDFWCIRWLALHGEMMLFRVRGSNDLLTLKESAIDPVYKIPRRSIQSEVPKTEPSPPIDSLTSGQPMAGRSYEKPHQAEKKDFFVSYNRADRTWAEWIAWHLEEAGYTTFIQAWDFRPGGNFVIEMQRAAEQARRTLAVLSPDYLQALYTQPEWAAAFAQDPTGEKGTLLPVRVRECELKGLLPQIVYIDLVGLDQEAAKGELITGVKRGRAKPAIAPGFPGAVKHATTERPDFPGGASSG